MSEKLKMIDCEVQMQKEWAPAKLVGFYQFSNVKQAIFVGEIGGVTAYPVAVVCINNQFKTVNANLVRLVTGK